MKREEFIKHLRLYGCEFLREGGNHTVYVNRREKKLRPYPGIGKSMRVSAAKYVRI